MVLAKLVHTCTFTLYCRVNFISFANNYSTRSFTILLFNIMWQILSDQILFPSMGNIQHNQATVNVFCASELSCPAIINCGLFYSPIWPVVFYCFTIMVLVSPVKSYIQIIVQCSKVCCELSSLYVPVLFRVTYVMNSQ